MSENHSLLDQLEKLLSWKKSKKFYAEKLGITEYEVYYINKYKPILNKDCKGEELFNIKVKELEFISELTQQVWSAPDHERFDETYLPIAQSEDIFMKLFAHNYASHYLDNDFNLTVS